MVWVKSKNLGDGHLPADPNELKKLFITPGSRSLFQTIQVAQSSMPYRMISYRSGGRNGSFLKSTYVLQIAVPQTLIEQSKTGLLAFFWMGIPLSLLISAAGGFFLSTRALKPVSLIIKNIHAMSVTKLTDRLPLPRPTTRSANFPSRSTSS